MVIFLIHKDGQDKLVTKLIKTSNLKWPQISWVKQMYWSAPQILSQLN